MNAPVQLPPPPGAAPEPPDDEVEASRAPLMDHLTELRTRLVRVLWCIAILFVGAWFVAQPALGVLLRPMEEAAARHGYVIPELQPNGPAAPETPASPEAGAQPAQQSAVDALSKEVAELKRQAAQRQFEAVTTGPLEMIFVKLKLAFLIAIAAGFPYIAFQIYAFVAPGLYRKERSAVLPFLFAMPALFAVGTAAVYFYVLPLFMDLTYSQEFDRVSYLAQVKPYYELAISLLTAFGLAFQLPVVLALLARAGVVQASGLRKGRRYAFVAIMIAAAVMTPADPFSFLVLAAPLYALYEGGIIAAAMIERGRKRAEAAEAKREAEEAAAEAAAEAKREASEAADDKID